MNGVDALLLLGVAAFSILGAHRGLAAQALSLGGLALGAVLGSLIAPHLFPDNSAWLPVAGLMGALAGAFVLGTLAGVLSRPVRLFVVSHPPLATLDRIGGIALGGLIALAIGWLLAVLALHQPALGLRAEVRSSAILPRLLSAVPPDRVLQALNRFDPLPLLPGLEETLPPPDPSVLRSPGARAASESVVKLQGTACGVGTQGSGWVVRSGLVATNAHVIAGHGGTRLFAPNGQVLQARPVYVDATNDIALLRVRGLGATPLRTNAQADRSRPVALLGYPQNGPLTATAATAGAARTVLSPDAYGQRTRPRVVVPLRGPVRPGESGGPVVDRRGRVVAMIFGGTRDRAGGYAVPVELVLDAAAGPLRRVPSGPCIVE
ncbi:MAG TPA: MarP family serine protease [Gaiellaceae bacterium]|nr:MarP family serine protease [Gaiellaceae bacterium]